MKKFLLLIVCLLTVAGAYSVEPVFQFSKGWDRKLGFALTADDKAVSMLVEKKGSDAVYTIYNPDFSIVHTFTIKGAYTYSAEIEENRDNKEAEHPDLTAPFDLMGYSTVPANDVFAIQGLGQDPEKWYVFVYNLSWTQSNGLEEYTRDSWSVYDESGNVICSFNTTWESSFYYYRFGDKMYLVAEEEEYKGDGLYEYSFNFFNLSRTSGINAPVAVNHSSSQAYPNPLPQGKSFTIELSEIAPEGTKVAVSDMNGSIVYRAAIQAGADKVIIPSRKLRHGNLVYSVYAGETILEKGKIIVR